jgi:hypothetical protein
MGSYSMARHAHTYGWKPGAWLDNLDFRIQREHSSKPTVTPLDEIMACSTKKIWSETRTWVVDGRVVTASGYKIGTTKRYTAPSQIDGVITEYAQACVDCWQPNAAFVLDVADTPEGLKILEINNINAAGLYRGDMLRLVSALATLVHDSR